MRTGDGWRVGASVALALLASCAAPASEDTSLLEPLHGPISSDMLVAPEAQSNRDDIAALEALEGVWTSQGIIDGQTLVLVSVGASVRVRLAGITTPTGDECLAPLAVDSLRFIVGGSRQLGLDADLEGPSSEVRPGYVTTIDGDDLGEVMLRLGLATLDQSTLDETHRAGYEAEMTAAQNDGVGIWDDTACLDSQDSSDG
ncbi:MAG: hypothetical protein ABIP17_11695 [Ilumatobacteraceae bacterium]